MFSDLFKLSDAHAVERKDDEKNAGMKSNLLLSFLCSRYLSKFMVINLGQVSEIYLAFIDVDTF